MKKSFQFFAEFGMMQIQPSAVWCGTRSGVSTRAHPKFTEVLDEFEADHRVDHRYVDLLAEAGVILLHRGGEDGDDDVEPDDLVGDDVWGITRVSESRS
jgi:hypothetical protein